MVKERHRALTPAVERVNHIPGPRGAEATGENGVMESRLYPGEHNPEQLIRLLRREFLGEYKQFDSEEALGIRVALLYFERHCVAVWFVPVAGGLSVTLRNNTRWTEAAAAVSGSLAAAALMGVMRIRTPAQLSILGLWWLARGVPKVAAGFRLQGRIWSCLEAELL